MANSVTPEVLWAQRSSATDAEKNVLYVTLSVPDVPASSAKLNLTSTSISFTGTSETKKVEYKVDLELYAEIDVEKSKTHHSARGVDMVLRKKEMKEEYWPRLLKESKKMHFLKTDFDKWVDEDEQDEAEDDGMGDFGGMGGMPGMGGMGGEGGLGGIDFSKLGGAGGMDLSALQGMQGMGGEGEGSDDDEMPELEDADKSAGDASKPKIEEVS